MNKMDKKAEGSAVSQGELPSVNTRVEPVVIILMGLAVAAMLLSVYIPIFNIIRIAR